MPTSVTIIKFPIDQLTTFDKPNHAKDPRKQLIIVKQQLKHQIHRSSEICNGYPKVVTLVLQAKIIKRMNKFVQITPQNIQ